jgi:hypothetical protein
VQRLLLAGEMTSVFLSRESSGASLAAHGSIASGAGVPSGVGVTDRLALFKGELYVPGPFKDARRRDAKARRDRSDRDPFLAPQAPRSSSFLGFARRASCSEHVFATVTRAQDA